MTDTTKDLIHSPSEKVGEVDMTIEEPKPKRKHIPPQDSLSVTQDSLSVNLDENALPSYLFHQGTNYEAWRYLGVHCIREKGESCRYIFRTWAPNALAISVVGDLTDWEGGFPMRRITEGGLWEADIPCDKSWEDTYYKFAITGKDGKTWLKADPYATYNETLQKTASIIHTNTSYSWHDEEWLRQRERIVCPRYRGFKPRKAHFYGAPMNIYEMHLGSWKTLDGASNVDGAHYLDYRTIADKLVEYLTDMGYTHVELLPVMEHPYDGSWGYQVCGYYAPTSRYGKPEDFKYFVDTMHQNGIGVILDWVPAHFPKDRHGLYEFDGQPLYEYQGWDRQEHKVWGTRFFDLGRPEVQSFLVSNALYWLTEFHADGLRVDAVASMLYLDFDKNPGEWVPAPDGSNKNPEAIAFCQKLSSVIHDRCPDALLIAEESTDWPMLTKPVSEGGLGFSFKWNMGWANDLFDYVQCDPIGRQYIHEKLTFPLMYAFNENYVLPISHDEVVHGKKTLVDKMFGEYDDKFACMRTCMLYMMTLPGKKLTFMGTEFAQFREWDYENQLEWFMTDYPRHVEMQRFIRALNMLYKENSQLWEIDDGWDGFQWIDPNQDKTNTLSYRRRNRKGQELIVVLNFSPVLREGYTVVVPKMGRYEEVLTTDRYEFGGKNHLNENGARTSYFTDVDGTKKNQITITLPSMGGVVLRKFVSEVREK